MPQRRAPRLSSRPSSRPLRTLAVLFAVLALLAAQASCAAAPTPIPGHPRVRIETEKFGSMVVELYPEYAPETVANFLSLARSGFYDGLTFHRIVKGFMIQGGDPKGDGTGGSEKRIKGEFIENGFQKNTLLHTTGVISMARSKDMDSASSQFFLMDGAATWLDGKYAAFGKIVEGKDTLDAIADVPVHVNPASGEKSQPDEPVVILSVVVLEETSPTP